MELQDIVNRLRMNQSIKAIKRETGKHRSVIRRLLQLAGQEGWLDEQQELPSEHQLQEVYHEQRIGEEGRQHPLDAHREQIEGWGKEGYSFLVIHKLLEQRGVEYSETTVRRYIHRQFPAPVRPVMRRETKAGEVMEVDFGHLGLTWDVNTRSRRRTWVFSGRLRHSRRAYREVVFDQKQETFFACHIHAFEWFGGVSEKVTPDNLKAAVIVASFEDPLVNRAYRQLALHYGFLISPCLPYHPEHKGGVEGDIKYVKRNFLPLLREAQKERGHETPYSDELVDELERWNRESYDLHIVQKVGRTPLELFETEEAGALKPLPVERWDQVVCKEASVGPDWRVQFEKAFYTVPYRLIGERVLVLGNSQVVRVFLDYEEVTAHPRATELWQVRRRPEHPPPELEQYLNLTHDGLVRWAQRLGPSVALVAGEIFADKAVDGMRPVRALIRLADKYTALRLEAACRRALHFATPSYRSVKNILVHELDRLPEQQPVEPSNGQLQFRFARAHGYFDTDQPAQTPQESHAGAPSWTK